MIKNMPTKTQSAALKAGYITKKQYTRNQCADLVLQLPFTTIRPESNDRPGDFKARHQRCTRRWIIFSLALQHVRTIDTRSRHFDQNLTSPWYRHRAPSRN